MNTQDIKVDPQSPQGSAPFKAEVLKALIQKGEFDQEFTPHVLVYDKDRYQETLQKVIQLFPQTWLHTSALKSNMLHQCLLMLKENNFGFEAASFGELQAALNTQIDPSKIVFDSPVKTLKEIQISLENGIYLNLDNFQELERVARLMETKSYPKAKIGIRINPQVGTGKIAEMSTAGDHSKFGISLSDYSEELFRLYEKYEWLTGVHVHSGSQGVPIDKMIMGIQRICQVTEKINSNRKDQIQFIDIGGGLPVNFDSEAEHDEDTPSFEEYFKQLQAHCPLLFSGKFKVITEFGRRLNAKSGFYFSRVEYTKRAGKRNIAAVHGGTDFFLRTVFMPTKWAIRLSVLDSTGSLRIPNENTDPIEKQDIVGPCCFAADVIGHERSLPLIHQNDYILAHDVGAYYFSSYSYYNSRQAPGVYWAWRNQDQVGLELIRKPQSVEETLAFYQ